MSNKTALITGASSGIGEAFARQLAAQGYDLLLTGRRKENLESIASELRTRHEVRAETLVADLSRDEGIDLVENWARKNSPIHMLINNAGFGARRLFSDGNTDITVDMIHVHAIAPVRLMGAVLPAMKEGNEGIIINVSSPAAYTTLPGNGTYAGTKAFLNAFSESLARELAGTNIKIQILLPGFTYSDFHKRPAYKDVDMYSTLPKFLWMTSENVARISLKALERGSLYCIPSTIYKFLTFFGRMGLSKYLGSSALRRLGREQTK